jgi:membrane fusion protein
MTTPTSSLSAGLPAGTAGQDDGPVAGPAAGLFRAEALAQQRVRLWGEVSLRTPAALHWLGVALLLLTLAAGLFLTLGEFPRKERVRGVLRGAGSDVLLHAEAPGVVSAVLVRAGERVVAGQPLVQLATASRLPDGRASSAVLAAELERQLAGVEGEVARERMRDTLQRAALEDRIAADQRDLGMLADTLARQRRLEALGVAQLARIESLARQGQVAQAQLGVAQAEQLQRGQARADAERAWHVRNAELRAAQRELQRAPLERDARLAALAQRASELRQRRVETLGLRGASLAAPFTGVIGDVYVAAGEQVAREAVLLSLVRRPPFLLASGRRTGDAGGGPQPSAGAQAAHRQAAHRVEAVLLVPSRAAGFIRPGQVVRLRYEAFPYQRFGSHLAVVSNVDAALLLPGDVDLPVVVQEPVLRVRARPLQGYVAAYGQRVPLRPGLAFDADVLLERRTLLQWLFDPLRAQLGR